MQKTSKERVKEKEQTSSLEGPNAGTHPPMSREAPGITEDAERTESATLSQGFGGTEEGG